MSSVVQHNESTSHRPVATQGHALILHQGEELPENIQNALHQLQLSSLSLSPDQANADITKTIQVDIAIIIPDHQNNVDLNDLISHLKKESIPVVVLHDSTFKFSAGDFSVDLILIPINESDEKLAGRLETLIQMRPTLKRLRHEIQRLDKITQPVNTYITQLDEEMRLAARLQRDFLPQQLPKLQNIRFATIYRPATWVSGDIYDIMRLDEEHIGFYIADAVGHGMPAALLTIFIKRALVTKIITGNSYQLVEPGAALSQLGSDMVNQELSNFQFATCCYGILNIKTLRLRIASAGHPPPMLIHNDSKTTELDVLGALLGVFPDQQYDTKEYQLHPGEKLLLYSDGVEVVFTNEGPDKPLRFRKEFDDLAHCDIDTMCNRLLTIINQEEGSLHPRDDVTIVGIELLKSDQE